MVTMVTVEFCLAYPPEVWRVWLCRSGRSGKLAHLRLTAQYLKLGAAVALVLSFGTLHPIGSLVYQLALAKALYVFAQWLHFQKRLVERLAGSKNRNSAKGCKTWSGRKVKSLGGRF